MAKESKLGVPGGQGGSGMGWNWWSFFWMQTVAFGMDKQWAPVQHREMCVPGSLCGTTDLKHCKSAKILNRGKNIICCEYTKNHWHFQWVKWVNSTVCELHLNKLLFNLKSKRTLNTQKSNTKQNDPLPQHLLPFPGAQKGKGLALPLSWLRSLLWCRFDPWPRNFCLLPARPKN